MKKTEEEIQHIYRLYFTDVYRFLAAFTYDQHEVEDLTQEVFIRLFKSLSSFRGESELKTWLFSIAKHVAIDNSKKRKRQKVIQEQLFKYIPSISKSPEDLYTSKEDVNSLYVALKELKHTYKAVIILRGIQECSISETASIMGWSEAKVKVTYHRAIKKLKVNMLELNSGIEERWV
ncbi:RNA polymerase sigma factor [Alkalihalophilus marmarensis]|uniref:RNA polymerase sigma factor n=1 Tax=Alkalihalophilus marmarensis TaxID=521377 RepID=UPI002DBE669D|nr:RNA polymerase sigma factor [Alkalihalophilus marmarensis]MEC2070440.1 RNA polymerase sigma factor [Alkalihalophilus marmarensis]